MTEQEPIKIKVFEPEQSQDTRRKILNKNIPKPPYRQIIVGTTGSGKSNLIKNYIFNFYKDYFQEIYIFCGSLDDCEEYERISEKTFFNKWNNKKERLYKSKREPMSSKVSVFRNINEKDLMELYEDIEEEQQEKGKKFPILFVFDDMITDRLFKRSVNSSVIDSLFVKGRHINLSVIVATQRYRLLNLTVRDANSSQVVVFNGVGEKELDAIAEEHSGHLEKDDFKQLYKETTREPFTFLVVNTKAVKTKRFQNSQFQFL